MLLLYAVVIGLLLGLLAGGRLEPLARARFRWWPLALGGLMFQLLLFSPLLAPTVGDAGPALYVGSTAVVLAALLVNIRQPGFVLIALGALLNMIVIVANGGQMPGSAEAFAALHGVAAVPTDDFSNSTLIGPQTRLPFLGDIFVLPRPLPFANVFSIGDVLIGVGGGAFIVRTMQRRTPKGAAGSPARSAARARSRSPAASAQPDG